MTPLLLLLQLFMAGCAESGSTLPVEIPPPVRAARVQALRDAEAQEDLEAAAFTNALLARDAIARARRIFSIIANRSWEGRLVFDPPRHEAVWGLDGNYPRRNSFPEWFPVEAERTYVVRDLRSGHTRRLRGAALLAGVRVAIASGGEVVALRVDPE